MDIRRAGLFGYLSLNGRNIPLHQFQGSTMSLIAEILKSLQAERSRLDGDGAFEVMIRIRNKPMDTSKEGVMILGRAEEVGALLEGNGHVEADTPRKGESYEEFYHRLLDEQYPEPSAEFIAAQWFGREVNPQTTQWLNDPKAIRFRVLNTRDEEFEAALPSEYDSLKNYVKRKYPDFVAHLTFRTA
jgi:hypothetical protein